MLRPRILVITPVRHVAGVSEILEATGDVTYLDDPDSAEVVDQLADFDFSDFWCTGEYADSLSEPAPNASTIESVEAKLGYSLPDAYKELCRSKNGGLPKNRFHASPTPTSYGADDHIEIAEIYAIGETAQYSLGGPGADTSFWVNECGYPTLGVYFANCPDHGHKMLALDYRHCGKDGEHRVVLVDEIEDYEIIKLADTFADFVRGLKQEGYFDPAE